jgi:hypothetical protein
MVESKDDESYLFQKCETLFSFAANSYHTFLLVKSLRPPLMPNGMGHHFLFAGSNATIITFPAIFINVKKKSRGKQITLKIKILTVHFEIPKTPTLTFKL